MDLDVDSTSILYGVGALLGTATVLYFSRQLIFDLSPTVKSALLFGGFAALLLGAVALRSAVIEKTLYVLSSVSYLTFLGYALLKFRFGTTETFLALGLSSALFIGLGYVLRERGDAVSPETVRYAVAAVLVLGAGLVAVDAAGAQPTYEARFADEVNASEDGKATIGTLTVRNGFVLSRDVDLPRYTACIYTPERRRVFVDAGDAPGLVAGGNTVAVNLTVRIPVQRDVNGTAEPAVAGPIPVERRETCPETADREKIVVVEGERRFID